MRALMYMLLAAVAFAVLWVLVRLAAQELHPFAIAVWRNLFGLLWLLPVLAMTPRLASRRHLPAHIRRATAGVVATFALFYAIAAAPFVQVAAIGYAAGLFAPLLALLFRRQRVGRVGAVALALGLGGLLLVLRPGMVPLAPGMVAALLAALASGFSILSIRAMPADEDPRTLVVWSFLLMTPASVVVALPFLSWPSPALWGILAGIGAAAASGQLALARAVSLGDPLLLLPADLVRFVLLALAGATLFAEGYDWLALAGGVLLCVAGFLIVHRAGGRDGGHESALAAAAIRLGANDN